MHDGRPRHFCYLHENYNVKSVRFNISPNFQRRKKKQEKQNEGEETMTGLMYFRNLAMKSTFFYVWPIIHD